MIQELIFKICYKRAKSWDCLQELLKNEHLSRSDIDDLQMSRIKKLLSQAASHCPYYQELFKKRGFGADGFSSLKEFPDIPILTKSILKENLSEMKSPNISDNDMVKSGTGGSTGSPTHFYIDKSFSRYINALKVRNLMWTGWLPGEWDFRLWGSAFDVNLKNEIKNKIILFLRRVKFYPAFKLDHKLIKDFIADIKKYKPAIIQGYNMPLVVVARYILDNNIKFGYQPKGVINCAETLFESQREIMESAFDCKVFNRYGGRELSDICHECKYGNMHINEDSVYVEILDDNNNPVPDGTMGNIILTGLLNHAMPFIRYRVEDMGILAPKEKTCPCGLPFRIMEKVLGRSQDMIKLGDNKYLAGEFFPHLFKDFDILKFQVVQESLDKLTVSLVRGGGMSDEDIAYLNKRIKEYLGEVNFSFNFVNDIPTTPSGKFRFTISRV